MSPQSLSAIRRRLEELERDALESVGAAADRPAVEGARVALVGKKGALTSVLRGIAGLSPGQRPQAGKLANSTKERIEAALASRLEELVRAERGSRLEGRRLDMTLPSYGPRPGHRHPLSLAMKKICGIFCDLGFGVAEGPDIEDDRHNFEALNIPAEHPARDMQDTFFVEGGMLLRTHTSPVQIRTLESRQPPVMIIAPGAAYRQDDDATHSPMFHQVEGLMVDEGISFANLKSLLTVFLHRLFGSDVPVRFRPSYFPFTEPSAEVDIGCVICGGGKGPGRAVPCRVCKETGWLEILGCGMVHPLVFEHVGYDPQRFTGFAFGLGVERVAMLLYGVDDLRLFFSGDLRFLSQF